jgi:hypothetical protein
VVPSAFTAVSYTWRTAVNALIFSHTLPGGKTVRAWAASLPVLSHRVTAARCTDYGTSRLPRDLTSIYRHGGFLVSKHLVLPLNIDFPFVSLFPIQVEITNFTPYHRYWWSLSGVLLVASYHSLAYGHHGRHVVHQVAERLHSMQRTAGEYSSVAIISHEQPVYNSTQLH